MTITDLTVAGLRVLGCAVILLTALGVLQVFSIHEAMQPHLTAGEIAAQKRMVIGFSILLLAGSLCLVRFAVPLARRIGRHPAVEEAPLNQQQEQLQRLGLFLIGAFLLAHALPELLGRSMLYFHLNRSIPSHDARMSIVTPAGFEALQASLKVAMGAVFLLSPDIIVQQVKRLRGASRDI